MIENENLYKDSKINPEIYQVKPICRHLETYWLNVYSAIEMRANPVDQIVQYKDLELYGQEIKQIPFKQERFGIETGLVSSNFRGQKITFVVNQTGEDTVDISRIFLLELSKITQIFIPEVDLPEDYISEYLAKSFLVENEQVDEALDRIKNFQERKVFLTSRYTNNRTSELWYHRYDLHELSRNSNLETQEKDKIFAEMLEDNYSFIVNYPSLFQEFVEYSIKAGSIINIERLFEIYDLNFDDTESLYQLLLASIHLNPLDLKQEHLEKLLISTDMTYEMMTWTIDLLETNFEKLKVKHTEKKNIVDMTAGYLVAFKVKLNKYY